MLPWDAKVSEFTSPADNVKQSEYARQSPYIFYALLFILSSKLLLGGREGFLSTFLLYG